MRRCCTKAMLYAAFHVQVLHWAHKNQATIWATILASRGQGCPELARQCRTLL